MSKLHEIIERYFNDQELALATARASIEELAAENNIILTDLDENPNTTSTASEPAPEAPASLDAEEPTFESSAESQPDGYADPFVYDYEFPESGTYGVNVPIEPETPSTRDISNLTDLQEFELSTGEVLTFEEVEIDGEYFALIPVRDFGKYSLDIIERAKKHGFIDGAKFGGETTLDLIEVLSELDGVAS